MALPAARRGDVELTRLFAPGFLVPAGAARSLAEVRKAIAQRSKLSIDYVDSAGRRTARTVCPLGLYFWGTTWSIAAWCESRNGFRSFRLDRIRSVEVTRETFEEIPGRTLDDFVRSRQA